VGNRLGHCMTIRVLGIDHAKRHGDRLVGAIRNPLYRSSYALVANTAGTTAIGVLYWALATHLYSKQAVGQSSALISALLLASSIAQLNLYNTLPRFLAPARRLAGRLIVYSYAVTTVFALAAGAAFVLVMPRLSAHWQFLGDSTLLAGLFVVAMVAWGIFALEDAALTGLGRAVVVPVENTGYGVIKLVVLIAVAAAMPAAGIIFSWIVPLAVCVPVINWLIFKRYLPSRDTAQLSSQVGRGDILRQASKDFVGSLFGQAYVTLPALLVLSALGATASGYFYIAWTISYGLQLVAQNFATSLLVEGSMAPHRLAELTRGGLARSLLLVIAGALAMIAGSRLILGIYGASYAGHDMVLLSLLALGMIPRCFVLLALSLDRIAGRTGRAAVTQAALAAAVLGGTIVLLPRNGIEGVGLAWLGAHLLMAVFRLPVLIATARGRSRGRHRAPSAHASTRWVRELRPDRGAAGYRAAATISPRRRAG
jgi:O-antigen/teichoic acid export membrane protein